MVGGSSALTLDSHSGAVTPGGFGIWLLKAGLYPKAPPPPFPQTQRERKGNVGRAVLEPEAVSPRSGPKH